MKKLITLTIATLLLSSCNTWIYQPIIIITAKKTKINILDMK